MCIFLARVMQVCGIRGRRDWRDREKDGEKEGGGGATDVAIDLEYAVGMQLEPLWPLWPLKRTVGCRAGCQGGRYRRLTREERTAGGRPRVGTTVKRAVMREGER
jgi:hypothetical protein